MADDLDQRLLQFVEVERIGVAQVKGRLAVLELQPKDSLMLVFVESDAEGHLPVQTQQIRSATGRPVERSVSVLRPDIVSAFVESEHQPISFSHAVGAHQVEPRSEEHTSELQSLMRISYA